MSGPVRPPLTVETVDGTTEGRPITTIKVSNGDLTISGNTATIDTSGSGGTPGGSDTEIQYNNAGAFGGDAGLKITTKGGGSSTTIQSGNVLLGGNKLATGIANGSLFLTTDGSGQIFIQSGNDQGGTFTDTQVNIKSNTNTDNAILNFGDSSNPNNGRITLKDDGNLEVKNSVSGKNVFLEVVGSAGVTIKQATTDTDSTFTVEGNGTGTPKINLTNSTKSVTMLCDVNQKLKVEGGTDSFVFDVSSASGGITFPDGTTQTTAASGVSFPLLGSDGSAGAPTYSFSSDTDTGVFRPATGQIGFTMNGSNKLSFGSAGEILIGGSDSGTSGQVLTSGGSGSAMSWADASGGGDTTYQMGSVSGVAYGTTASTFGQSYYDDISASSRTINNYATPRAFPLVAQETGTLASITLNINGSASGDKVLVGIYSNVNGLPNTLLGSATIPTDSTGYITQTSFSSSVSLTAGELFWIAFGTDNTSSSASVRRLSSPPSFGVVFTDSDESGVDGYVHSSSGTTLPSTFSPTSGGGFRPIAYYTVS
tara:strand:+ start:681 stop:2294 length:1614 start_codon:yes stop_codon:yes gene_type:complete